MVIAAGMNLFHLSLAFEDILSQIVTEGPKGGIGDVHGEPYSSVFGALYLENECSNELWECKKPGPLADFTDLRCFSICIAEATGCRSCCSGNTCYEQPRDDESLGSCGPCPDDEKDEQCALPSVACKEQLLCMHSREVSIVPSQL